MEILKCETDSSGYQVFVRKVIELHDKYLAYVNDCFNNHTLFHKVGTSNSCTFSMISTVYIRALECFVFSTIGA